MWYKLKSYLKATRAAAAVEFAFVFPALIVITVGSLDLTLALAEMHLNNEAARAAARVSILGDAFADLTYNDTDTVVCTGSGTSSSASYSCTNADSSNNTTDFQRVINAALATKAELLPANLSISYIPSTFDTTVTSGSQSALLTTPVVSVKIINNTYSTIILGILPGVSETMTLPDVVSTRMSPSIITSLS